MTPVGRRPVGAVRRVGPMRIVFSSVGGHGHTYPLVPLALAARDAGHDILWATTAPFHPLLRGLGFTPLLAGIEMRQAFGELPDLPDRASMTQEQMVGAASRVFGEVIPRRTAADLVPLLAEHRADVVVHESANAGAGIAARRAGVRGVCHGFGRVPEQASSLFNGSGTVAVAAEFGVELPADVLPGLGDPYVDICPPSLQSPRFLATVPRVPLRPDAFTPPGELPAWVAGGGPPLVYLTMGTAFGDPTVMARAIAGLGRLDARVLVAAGPTVDLTSLGELPSNVRVEAWVPQAEVLPHTALVVHHGGSGTTLGCLAAGVPQLVIPQGADQFENATMVVGSGSGDQLLPGELTADAITDAAARLLEDQAVHDAADRLAAEIAAMPAPSDVARELFTA